MNRLRFTPLLVLLVLSFPLLSSTAWADTQFSIVNGTTGDGGTLTGTLVVNTAGLIISTDITYSGVNGTFTFTGTGNNPQTYDNGQFYIDDFLVGGGEQTPGGAGLTLLIDSPSLGGGYAGSPLCTFGAECDREIAGLDINTGGTNYVTVGVATGSLGDPVVLVTTPPVSTTPEPSSLILLGTGLLGAFGSFSRRMER